MCQLHSSPATDSTASKNSDLGGAELIECREQLRCRKVVPEEVQYTVEFTLIYGLPNRAWLNNATLVQHIKKAIHFHYGCVIFSANICGAISSVKVCNDVGYL